MPCDELHIFLQNFQKDLPFSRPDVFGCIVSPIFLQIRWFFLLYDAQILYSSCDDPVISIIFSTGDLFYE